MSQCTLDEIREAIRAFGENSDQQALMDVAEAVENAVDACAVSSDDEEDDDSVIEVTNTEEVDHLTTIQLMQLQNSITSVLVDRALAADDDEDDEDDEGDEGDDDEDDGTDVDELSEDEEGEA